jgi:hypothetical protein
MRSIRDADSVTAFGANMENVGSDGHRDVSIRMQSGQIGHEDRFFRRHEILRP